MSAAPTFDARVARADRLGHKLWRLEVRERAAPGTVQAIMDSAAFALTTPRSFFKPRKSVTAIDDALDTYHGAVQANKLAAMDALLLTINNYLAAKPLNHFRRPAVIALRNAAVLERPRVVRLDTLSQHGVTATLANIGTAAGLTPLQLANLAALGQVTTIRQLVTLHNLPRADNQIIALAALPALNTFARLRGVARSARPNGEILALADLGGAGLGGNALPRQPTAYELDRLVTTRKTLLQYTRMMASGVVRSAADLIELATTNRVQAAIDALESVDTDNAMDFFAMQLHYGIPLNEKKRGWNRAGYLSVYAISGAARKLHDAATSKEMLALLKRKKVLQRIAVAVPPFLVSVLKAGWRRRNTGAEGVSYATGSDRVGDTRL